MPRPQKYTESDILAAIQALEGDGEDINPMRVRMRLGGGNVGRIKAVIKERASKLALEPGSVERLPEALSREFQRLSSEVSQSLLSAATKCWTAALAESGRGPRDENLRLRKQVEALDKDKAASADLLAQVEAQRDERSRAAENDTREMAELARKCTTLQSALRNAESDLRAAQRVIENLERNQRQDREEFRVLQKRIESLVAEIAVLRTKPSDSGAQKPKSIRRKPA